MLPIVSLLLTMRRPVPLAAPQVDGWPTVAAFRLTNAWGEAHLVFFCVPCQRWHAHGAGDRPGDGDGHRVAHCWNSQSPYRVGPKSGYVLEEVGPISLDEMQRLGDAARREARTLPA